MRFSTFLTTATSLVSMVSAAFDENSKNNVVLYWGQNSAGSQGNLASYCENDDADVLILSFLIGFNDPITLNFANACETVDSTTGVLKCDQIAEDIKTCQSKGKKVLLSMGGASGSYGFTSEEEGAEFATKLWDIFGEGSSETRPFGDATVDGFDFDIENNNQVGYVSLANKLREYFNSASKKYYLAAAPQCFYPDASVGDLLTNSYIDFAYIQFYNNYCSIDGQFNYDTWSDFAKNTSPNKNIKLYLGLPASSSAAGSGYVGIGDIKSTLNSIYEDANFGGVMLWDASQSAANQIDGSSFAGAIKKLLNSLTGSSTTTSKTQSLSTTTINAVTSTSTTSITPNVATSTSTTFTTRNVVTSTSTTSTSAPTTTFSDTYVDLGKPASKTTTTVAPPVAKTVTISDLLNKDVALSTATVTQTANTLSTVVVTASPEPTTPSNGDRSGCSALYDQDKVDCLNAQYEAGQFAGSPDNCETDEIACGPDGSFALCANGAWVNTQCAAGTKCYAFIENDKVQVGCNWA